MSLNGKTESETGPEVITSERRGVTTPTKELLANRRRDVLRELIGLAKDGKKAVELVDELNELDTLIRTYPDAVRGKYSSCRQPIEAVVKYLEERRTAARREDIIRAVVEGGFGGGGREQETAVSRSIGVFLNGTGARTKVLRTFNGLVGRGDWEDERFM